MVGAAPKVQPKRYQAELHQAMKAGQVEMDSPVRSFKTPSGRYINAGGTHRHVARQAMGKPSHYEIQNLGHEMHVSPIQAFQGRMKVRSLKRGSKAVEAGKKVRPVTGFARNMNSVLAGAADTADDMVWSHPSGLKPQARAGRALGLASAGAIGGAGLLVAAGGAQQRREWKKHSVSKSLSAFGVDHGKVLR